MNEGVFEIEFDVAVPPATGIVVDESAIESATFVQALAAEFNNMQEASGGVKINASELATSAISSTSTSTKQGSSS